MTYFIILILNFIVAYFIYEDSSFLKPLIHSIFLLILMAGMDLILKNKKKRKDHSSESTNKK